MVINGGVMVLVCAILCAGLIFSATSASAATPTWRERLDQLKAEAEARRLLRLEDRASGNEETPTPAPNENPDDESVPCTCSASLKLGRPEINWNGSQLIFTPRFDVKIRVRGNETADNWNLALNYSGQSSFTGDGIAAPAGSNFAGSDSWSGQCFNTRLNHTGHAGPAVSLTEISRNLFNGDKELIGQVKMQAAIDGCDTDNELRQFKFTVGDVGNLKVSSWRSAR